MSFGHEEGAQEEELGWAGRGGAGAGPGCAVVLMMLASVLEWRDRDVGSCMSQHIREPPPPPHLPPQPQLLSPWTLRGTSSRKQSRKATDF